MKLTPWFPGDVKPVRVGVYERDYLPSNPRAYCYWAGMKWSTWRRTPRQAADGYCKPSGFQKLPWRGVLK